MNIVLCYNCINYLEVYITLLETSNSLDNAFANWFGLYAPHLVGSSLLSGFKHLKIENFRIRINLSISDFLN